jgi:hypothetical protein
MPAQGSDILQSPSQDPTMMDGENGDASTEELQTTGFEGSLRRMVKVTRGDFIEWVISAVVFAVPMVLLVSPGDAASLLLPLSALLFGIVRRPRHLWGSWIASILLLWLAVGWWSLFREPVETDSENQETIVSFFFESILFTAVLVLFPLWLGRLAGTWLISVFRR